MYTSGTTGLPKGVVRTHAAELFGGLTMVVECGFTHDDSILNNKPLYACRYFMVKKHWQIYRHGNSRTASGGFDTLPTFEVPRDVLRSALAATQPIGDSLYGVDVKEKDGKGYVIEVNDNPNIDRGVEDKYLGEELYRLIMGEFLRRIEERGV